MKKVVQQSLKQTNLTYLTVFTYFSQTFPVIKKMKDYLKTFDILSNDEIDLLQNKVTYKKLKKGDYFIKEGKTSKEVAFVISGLFRSFYYSSSEE